MKPITVTMLREHGACDSQIEKFLSIFPSGSVLPTRALAIRYAQTFDINWLAVKLLSRSAYKAYKEAISPADKAYDEAIAPDYKAYKKAIALADRAYDETRAPTYRAYDEAITLAYRAYDEAIALADKAYKKAIALADRAYDEVRALAFLEQWEKDEAPCPI